VSGSRLLIDEPPLQVLPSLATEIGLNESIFVQQLHYWLGSPHAKEIEGKKWVYNTYGAWNEQFPFWSYDTVKRVITALEKAEVIETTARFNVRSGDRTKWYTINYEKLGAQAESPEQQGNLHSATGQSAPTEEGNLHSALPETTQRVSTENTSAEVGEAQANLPDDTTTTCLKILLSVEGFPRDQGENAVKLAEYREEFPSADPVEVCRDFKAWHEEHRKKPNRLRLRNFFKQANKSRFNGHRAPPEKPVPIAGDEGARRRREGYEWLFDG
jgi:hypothetical protein